MADLKGRAALMGVVALVAGCASSPRAKAPSVLPRAAISGYRPDESYRSDPSRSEADNMFLAASRTVRSWSRGDRVKNAPRPRAPHLTFGQRLGAVSSDLFSNGAAAASPTPGFGVVGTAVMAVAQSTQSLLMLVGVGNDGPLGGSGKYAPARHTSRLVFWMPRRLAADTKGAWRRVESLWADALASATPAFHAPYTGTLEQRGYGLSYFDVLGEQTLLTVRGGECDRPEISCGYETLNLELPEIADAPDFIGHGKVWVSAPALRYSSIDRSCARQHYASSDLPDLAVYRAISAHLPSRAYIYLAAGGISLGDGKGLLAEPLVLNRGRTLKFSNAKPVAP